MTFRDDRSALRERVEDLEQELAQAKGELEQRAEGPPAKFRTGLTAIALAAVALSLGLAYFGHRVGGEGGVVASALAAVLLSLAITAFVLTRCLVVVAPNQLAVISGRRHQLPDGQVLGFRIVTGGRVLRIPILEHVDYMDLSNRNLTFALRACYTKHGQRVNVQAVANVKVAPELPLVQNAVERFLCHDEEVARVAQQELEAALRGAVAACDAEELRNDPERVAAALIEEVDHSFSRLGLVLDTFRVRSVELV